MVKAITVINSLKERLRIELNNPRKSGFAVKGITGLGPPKANINTTEMITSDGSLYNSSRVTQRNIVLSLLYLPVPTIEEVRQLSYKFFPINKEVTLIIETDKRTAVTKGYIESNEPDIFSKLEGATISIICPDPYFYADGDDAINVTVFRGKENLFEFPLVNDSLEENLIELGAIRESTTQNIYYAGDSDVGVDIVMDVSGEVGDITVYKITTREQFTLQSGKVAALTGNGFIKGDRIVVRTSRGEKGVTLYRDGDEINILNCLLRGADWIRLTKGDNLITYDTTKGGEFLDFWIENKVIYEGV